jgi:hypothetical protein
LGFKASLNKKFTRPPISRKKQGMEVHTYHPSYSGSIKKSRLIWGKVHEILFEN